MNSHEKLPKDDAAQKINDMQSHDIHGEANSTDDANNGMPGRFSSMPGQINRTVRLNPVFKREDGTSVIVKLPEEP